MADLTVGRLMARHPIAIKAGTELTEVVEVLLQHHSIGLPVVDTSNKVIGFVSEQDCLKRLLITSYHSEGAVMVEQIMHPEPLTVNVNDSVVNIAEQMIQQKPKIYPVVNERGVLCGLLTREQVLRALKESRQGHG